MKHLLIVVLLTMLGTALISTARPTTKESQPIVGIKVTIPNPVSEVAAITADTVKDTFSAPVVEAKPVSASDSKEQWMAQAGIAQSDWQYVDYIISHESGWSYLAVNPSSGSTGLCQSLPANKMASAGDDYISNPVTQLKWCNSYAVSRYNSWAGAATAWKSKSWW